MLMDRVTAIRQDLARFKQDGVLYWADLVWRRGEHLLVFRCWDSTTPLAVCHVPLAAFPRVYRGEEDERVMSFLQRQAAGDQAKRVQMSAAGREWAAKHPAVTEYLTATTYPDGGQRQTATAMVFVDQGEWKVCLRDRDTHRTLWVTAGSLAELFTTLEMTLQGGSAEWRQEKAWEKPRGKKGG